MLTATYLTTNVYNTSLNAHSVVDLVVSYMPILMPMHIGGHRFDITDMSLPYVSMPVYASIVTANGQYVINSTITTTDINTHTFWKDRCIICDEPGAANA